MVDREKESVNRFKQAAICIIAAGVIAVGGCTLAYWAVFGYGERLSRSAADWATFGTYFSGVAGTIVTFGALVAVALTLHLQAKELAESRSLLKSQAATLAIQARTADRQAFDSNFYQLLKRFSDHVGSLSYGNQSFGRDAIAVILLRLQAHFGAVTAAGGVPDVMVEAYKRLYREREADLGVYFRLLYHVFKLIDRGSLTELEKIDYANLARAQLSATELCLLFYNCSSGEGASGFKPLVERYGLLKHLNRDLLVDPARIEDENLYSRNAFRDASARLAAARAEAQ